MSLDDMSSRSLSLTRDLLLDARDIRVLFTEMCLCVFSGVVKDFDLRDDPELLVDFLPLLEVSREIFDLLEEFLVAFPT